MNIYITRIHTADAEPAHPGQRVPEALYRLTINGVRQVADSDGLFWTSDFKRLDAAARRSVTTSVTDRIVWEPQYDSIMAEALDEPCGYVGRLA